MPSDPRAVSTAKAPIASAQRYATAAQARDLQRSLSNGVRWIEVACCGDAAVMQAISAALAQDADRQPAVFVSGADASLGRHGRQPPAGRRSRSRLVGVAVMTLASLASCAPCSPRNARARGSTLVRSTSAS